MCVLFLAVPSAQVGMGQQVKEEEEEKKKCGRPPNAWGIKAPSQCPVSGPSRRLAESEPSGSHIQCGMLPGLLAQARSWGHNYWAQSHILLDAVFVLAHRELFWFGSQAWTHLSQQELENFASGAASAGLGLWVGHGSILAGMKMF